MRYLSLKFDFCCKMCWVSKNLWSLNSNISWYSHRSPLNYSIFRYYFSRPILLAKFQNVKLPGKPMTSSRKMADFRPFWKIFIMKFYKWPHFRHLLFVIFQMGQSKFPFQNFLKFCLEGFVLKSDVIKKRPKTFPIDCAFFLVTKTIVNPLNAQ